MSTAGSGSESDDGVREGGVREDEVEPDVSDGPVAGDAEQEAADAETTVTVRCTGHVRRELGTHEFEYTFEGNTLRAFLDELFDEYPELRDMIIAETEAESTHSGWAPTPEELPGTWTKNPEGEQTIAYARILVNGRFNENRNGFDTELSEGDRVALVYPFMFCC